MTRLAYTVAQAAEVAGVSPDVIRGAIRNGALTAHYPTSRPVIKVDDLQTWLNETPTARAS